MSEYRSNAEVARSHEIRNRLERVLAVHKRQEEAARARLVQAHADASARAAEAAESALAAARPVGGDVAARLALSHRLSEMRREDYAGASERRAAADVAVAEAVSRWDDARMQVERLERLLHRRAVEARALAAVREQREIDDMVSTRWAARS